MGRERTEGTLPFAFRPDEEYLPQRAMLRPELRTDQNSAMRDRIQAIADRTVDTMLAGGPASDLMTSLSLPVAVAVICALLGVDENDRNWLPDLSRIVGSRQTSREEVATAQTCSSSCSPPGTGPSANMTNLAVIALLNDRNRLEELRDTDDPRLVTAAVRELLRYVTVSHNARQRVATADLTLGGQDIRRGEGVLLQLDSANRDESAYPAAHRLDLHRPGPHHLALGLGLGLHHCSGHALAELELEVVLNTLLRRIPTLALAQSLERIAFREDENIYDVHELWVTW